MRTKREPVRAWRTAAVASLALAVALVGARRAEGDAFSVLSAVGAERFGRAELPNPNSAGGDYFGWAFAAGDFNGDGVEDLAVGAHENDGPGTPVDRAGEVVVRYGQKGTGLAGPPTVLGQFVAGSPNPAEANDRFGSALVACNLNGDAYDDLVVGVPYETLVVLSFQYAQAGLVEIYYGSSAGLGPLSSTRLRELSTTQLDVPTSGSLFGSALACADFDANGYDDLAVGLPFRDLPNGAVDAGRVNVFPGSATGVGVGGFALDKAILGVGPAGEASEYFGKALATGDFDGDGDADLVIGVPGEAVGTKRPGSVHLVYGSAGGLQIGGHLLYKSEFEGNYDADGFGAHLAVGNFDGDVYDDLVAASPLRTVDGFQAAGLVYILYGGPIIGVRRDTFTQSTVLAPAFVDTADQFGHSVTAGDFDGDGVDDLAVGAPGDDPFLSPVVSKGAVLLLMGAAGLDDLSETDRMAFHYPGQHGYPGEWAEDFVFWGYTSGAGDFDGNGTSDLAVGAPIEDEDGLQAVGSVTILYGSLFADGFEIGLDAWNERLGGEEQ